MLSHAATTCDSQYDGQQRQVFPLWHQSMLRLLQKKVLKLTWNKNEGRVLIRFLPPLLQTYEWSLYLWNSKHSFFVLICFVLIFKRLEVTIVINILVTNANIVRHRFLLCSYRFTMDNLAREVFSKYCIFIRWLVVFPVLRSRYVLRDDKLL